MYDPTVLARYYASRAESFLRHADEASPISRGIYLRLAELFDGLALSADRFAGQLRGEPATPGKAEPDAPVPPAPAKPKRKRAARKPAVTAPPYAGAPVSDEIRH